MNKIFRTFSPTLFFLYSYIASAGTLVWPPGVDRCKYSGPMSTSANFTKPVPNGIGELRCRSVGDSDRPARGYFGFEVQGLNFQGEWVDGKPHGTGSAFWKSRDQVQHDNYWYLKEITSYVGGFKEGYFHGQGQLTGSGWQVVGEFFQGKIWNAKLSGVSQTYDWKITQGRWTNGFFQGYGETSREDFRVRWRRGPSGQPLDYKGEVAGLCDQGSASSADILPHGKGVLSEADGRIFRQGAFCEGSQGSCSDLTLQGPCDTAFPHRLVRADGTVYFEGSVASNFLPRQGIVFFKNGQYEGGVKELGQGLKFDGMGNLKWEDGREYSGAFVNGKMQGSGRYRYANGAVYEGAFAQGTFHGRGTLFSPDGKVLREGCWTLGSETGDCPTSIPHSY